MLNYAQECKNRHGKLKRRRVFVKADTGGGLAGYGALWKN
jgi:hypothetical protein